MGIDRYLGFAAKVESIQSLSAISASQIHKGIWGSCWSARCQEEQPRGGVGQWDSHVTNQLKPFKNNRQEEPNKQMFEHVTWV